MSTTTAPLTRSALHGRVTRYRAETTASASTIRVATTTHASTIDYPEAPSDGEIQ